MDDLEARTVCIDLDHTLCRSEGPQNYASAEPLGDAVEALTKLHDAGWVIVLYTARHFNHWKTTTEWLAKHELSYDQLVFGKPPARIYLDDRAMRFDGNWAEVVEKLGDGPEASAKL